MYRTCVKNVWNTKERTEGARFITLQEIEIGK